MITKEIRVPLVPNPDDRIQKRDCQGSGLADNRETTAVVLVSDGQTGIGIAQPLGHQSHKLKREVWSMLH